MDFYLCILGNVWCADKDQHKEIAHYDYEKWSRLLHVLG